MKIRRCLRRSSRTACSFLGILCTGAILFAGCMTRHADLSAYPAQSGKPSEVMLQTIEFDEYGLPLFIGKLEKRPTADGVKFTLAQFIEGRPIRSFDIVITSWKPDPAHPLKVIYEWTGKGFQAGIASGKAYTDSLLSESSKRGPEPNARTGMETTLAVGPVVLLSVGGFIVGIAASIPATAQELGNLIVSSSETVVSYTAYEYDFRNRLSVIRTYLPTDISHEIIKTDFFYQDDKATPSKTEITSYPEQTVRTIEGEPR